MATNDASVTRDPLRRTHRDLRRLVMSEGDAPAAALYVLFQMMNARFFAGRLADPLVLIAQTASPRALGDYCARDVHGIRSRIRIAPAVLRRGFRHAAATLLHEMVHAWAAEIALDTEGGYKGHGPRFAEKCNAIGRELGFPEVAPKGRGGLKKAEHWPELPEAVDLDADPALKPRKPREAKGDGEGEGDASGAADDAGDAAARALAAGIAMERERVLGFLLGASSAVQRNRQQRGAATLLGRLVERIERAEHWPEGEGNAPGITPGGDGQKPRFVRVAGARAGSGEQE